MAAIVNPDGEGSEKGNFWLVCDRPWSNRSINGKLLAIADLPGTVTTTAGFQGTVCVPSDWQTILRIIADKKDPDAASAADARKKIKSFNGDTSKLAALIRRNLSALR